MVGADAVAFTAHSPKMRDALGIVMRAPLVFLSAGSSPKRANYVISSERRRFGLIVQKFFNDDKLIVDICGMHLFDIPGFFGMFIFLLYGSFFSREIKFYQEIKI